MYVIRINMIFSIIEGGSDIKCETVIRKEFGSLNFAEKDDCTKRFYASLIKEHDKSTSQKGKAF